MRAHLRGGIVGLALTGEPQWPPPSSSAGRASSVHNPCLLVHTAHRWIRARRRPGRVAMEEHNRVVRRPPRAAARPRLRPGTAAAVCAIVLAVLAALIAGTPHASADSVFGDDFETGDLSRWSTVSGLTVQQQEVYAGSWAARGTSAGAGHSAGVQRTLAATQAEVVLRVRVKVLALSGTSSVNFVKLRTASGTAIAE